MNKSRSLAALMLFSCNHCYRELVHVFDHACPTILSCHVAICKVCFLSTEIRNGVINILQNSSIVGLPHFYSSSAPIKWLADEKTSGMLYKNNCVSL